MKNQTSILPPNELSDQLFYFKKITELLEDARKEVNREIELSAKVLCLQWLKQGDGEPVRGKIAISSPTLRSAPIPPKENTVEFERIRAHYNIPLEAFQVCDLSWPKLRRLVTELQKKGQPLPSCLESLPVETKFSVTSRQNSKVKI